MGWSPLLQVSGLNWLISSKCSPHPSQERSLVARQSEPHKQSYNTLEYMLGWALGPTESNEVDGDIGEGWGWASKRTKARTDSSNKEIPILHVSFICFVSESMKPFVAPAGLLLGWIFPNSLSRFPPGILFNLFLVHALCFFILLHPRSEECPPRGLQCLRPPIIPILFSFGSFYLMEQKLLLSPVAYSIMRRRREGDSVVRRSSYFFVNASIEAAQAEIRQN